jgi:hypothetical protein
VSIRIFLRSTAAVIASAGLIATAPSASYARDVSRLGPTGECSSSAIDEIGVLTADDIRAIQVAVQRIERDGMNFKVVVRSPLEFMEAARVFAAQCPDWATRTGTRSDGATVRVLNDEMFIMWVDPSSRGYSTLPGGDWNQLHNSAQASARFTGQPGEPLGPEIVDRIDRLDELELAAEVANAESARPSSRERSARRRKDIRNIAFIVKIAAFAVAGGLTARRALVRNRRR